MRIPHPALLAACVALSACGGGGSAGGPAAPPCVAGTACTPSISCRLGEVRCDASGPACVSTAPLPDGTACGEGATCGAGSCRRTITVTATDRYVDDAGHVVAIPRAALGETVTRALMLEPDGGYQAFPASAVAPGVVEIPGVPVGPCLVEWRYSLGSTVPSFTELSGNVLDQSSEVAGRPDVGETTAPLELLATGLAPWQGSPTPSDRIQVVSSNAGQLLDLWEPAILDGATEATIIPWEGLGTPLLDGASGDRVHVIQLARVDGPVPHVAAVRSGTLPATFRVEEGVAQSAPVTLGPIARTATLEADWALGEMEALLGEMGPSPGQYRSHHLVVDAAAHGLVQVTPTLLSLELGPGLGGTLQLGPLTYGNPFPDFFLEGAWADMLATMKVPLWMEWEPSITVDAAVGVWLGAPSAGRLAVRPAVSPPRDVRVAGLDVGGLPPVGVGTTPLISWSPPSIGTDLRYLLTIHRVVSSYSFSVARFWTASTEVKIPPGLLQAGVNHYARITASSPAGYAQTVTSAFVP